MPSKEKKVAAATKIEVNIKPETKPAAKSIANGSQPQNAMLASMDKKEANAEKPLNANGAPTPKASLVKPIAEDQKEGVATAKAAAKKPSTVPVKTPQVKKVVDKQAPAKPAVAKKAPVKKTAIKKEAAVATNRVDAKQSDKKFPAVTAKEGSAKQLKRIAFQVRYHTSPGQSIFVTGNHSLLGNGDYAKAFPLTYLNEDYWFGTLEVNEALTSDIVYNYLLVSTNGTTAVDWGSDKVIQPMGLAAEEVLLLDTWNAPSLMENTFYTEPFQEVLLKDNFTEVTAKVPSKITHTFRVKAPILQKGHAVCIIGSIEQLGEWNSANPLLLSQKKGNPWHTVSIDLGKTNFPFSYKYGVYNTISKEFIQFENGNNRSIYDGGVPNRLTIVSDGFAGIPYKGYKGAGVAIPVFSLRTAKSFGVGEFTDLKLLVDWAKSVGMKLVQLLPVNDTTATGSYTDSYPYAAISAFALHPLYLHLPGIVNKPHQSLLAAIEEQRLELNAKPAVDYVAVMAAKWALIHKIFNSQKEETFKNSGFEAYFQENAHWLVPYAAFCYFREKNKTSDFNQWETNQVYHSETINRLAASPMLADEELSIHFFVQYHLHLQLQEATAYAHQNGIIVKGDIPIGIYRNSCDAWQEPDLYNMDMQAGAPPDDFAIKGQNWGFPTYNWQKMLEDGFSWWKRRFSQMKYYFDAFRVDHILGFFRIWSIPMDAVEGIMGHFVPALPIHINEIAERGVQFNYDRLCKPFINETIVWDLFGEDIELVKSSFLNDAGYGNYTLKAEYDTQRKVEKHFDLLAQSDQNVRLKQGLFDLISNIILFADGTDGQQYHFRISMETTASFRYLDGHTQSVLKDLYVSYFFRRQDNFWAKEAMQKLPELKRSTNMLICGEDLGMVPDCVPGVMKDLAILSLEIQRMPKDPKREFFHPNDAPYLSVVTPSTHDMSTIRGWWEESRDTTQRFFNNELGQWGTAPYFCEPWISRIILMQHFYSPAMWSIFQMQDLMSTSINLRRDNPSEERINIPSDPKHYWRYRMHIGLEDLLKETEFNNEIIDYINQSGR